MTGKNLDRRPAAAPDDDLGISRFPLCREPWESYYILRRGILPCCYGNPILAPMTEYKQSWNSARLREIREYLSQGKLSPYCLESLGCPIVQRVLAKKRNQPEQEAVEIPPAGKKSVLRLVNRLLFGIPGKIRRRVRARSAR
ncbi:MAG: SPASM domain-containing protein [Acidobacteriota bacterium]|nr:SPASM domain-containing protein [Acidobacteriota bacterium]